MLRTATCSCGQLAVTMNGEPELIAVCHCLECQKSTGSVFTHSAYWPEGACQGIAGKAVRYRRMSDAGRWVDSHFCPTCGSSVYWHLELLPGLIGVSIGNFADPTFPAPTVAVWDRCRHPWVSLPASVPSYAGDVD